MNKDIRPVTTSLGNRIPTATVSGSTGRAGGTASIRPMTASHAFFNNPSMLPTNLFQIPDSRYTFTIYSLIKQQRFLDVVRVLEHELQMRSGSRSLLSLLAYSYYQLNQFESASQVYASLVQAYPDVEKYKLYYGQSLYKSGMYDEAMAICLELPPNSPLMPEIIKLQAAIKYQINDMAGCERLVASSQSVLSDYCFLMNQGCLLFRDRKFADAVKVWQECLKRHGNNNELVYYLALGYFMMREYVQSLQHLADIIERNSKLYPEYFNRDLDSADEDQGTDEDYRDNPESRKYVQNSQALHETYLIEAYNLKAAIEHCLKNPNQALASLYEMPRRHESQLDSISLHNWAVLEVEQKPSATFEKMIFLLDNFASGMVPPETLSNILLLYVGHDQIDAAADILAQSREMAEVHMDPFLISYINARVMADRMPGDAVKVFEEMESGFMSDIRDAMREVQEARELREESRIKSAIDTYDECVDKFLPVLMAHAYIFWDQKRYDAVEKLLRRYSEVVGDNDIWKINYANAIFMLERYADAIAVIEPLILSKSDNLTSLPAITIANLCVAYIMINQNSNAEDIMFKLEREEEQVLQANMNSRVQKPVLHLCIVNLVIGTLYCSRGNYEFGISRIISSLNLMTQKLSGETWLLAKRCLASLIEVLSKQMLVLKDSTFDDIIRFLGEIEMNGTKISAKTWTSDKAVLLTESVASEARQLKHLYLKVYDF